MSLICSPLIIYNILYYVPLNVCQNGVKNLGIMNLRLNSFWNCVYLFGKVLIFIDHVIESYIDMFCSCF